MGSNFPRHLVKILQQKFCFLLGQLGRGIGVLFHFFIYAFRWRLSLASSDADAIRAVNLALSGFYASNFPVEFLSAAWRLIQ